MNVLFQYKREVHMSGRKQHFIPQSLLRGFSREAKGSKQQVVAYTYDRGIFTAATDGIGAERNFYSELAVDGEMQTLDDKITEFENPLADVLTEFRMLPDRSIANTRAAATFVTHLVIRNDHFRKAVSSGGTAMLDGLQSAMSDEQTAMALLGLAGEKPSALFHDAMKKSLDEYRSMFAQLGLSEDQILEWAFDYVKGNFTQLHGEILTPMETAFAELGEAKMRGIAANAQRSVLDNNLSPEAWIERLSELAWYVSHSSSPLILPDCVAVAVDSVGVHRPLMLAEDTAEAIFVPISSNRLLVGVRGDHVPPSGDLNTAFAACSWDFFVAPERTDGLQTLREIIRSGVQEIMDRLVSDALEESVQNHSNANSVP